MSGVIVLSLRVILAACLYAFLGWILFISWKELQKLGVNLAARKPPTLNLSIQRTGTNTIYRVFQQSDVSIGRDPACDVCLDDDAVSGRHARLSYHHGQWWIEDLRSMNGTRLNQAPLEVPTVVTSGDQIECGHTALIVGIGTPADPSPTARL